MYFSFLFFFTLADLLLFYVFKSVFLFYVFSSSSCTALWSKLLFLNVLVNKVDCGFSFCAAQSQILLKKNRHSASTLLFSTSVTQVLSVQPHNKGPENIPGSHSLSCTVLHRGKEWTLRCNMNECKRRVLNPSSSCFFLSAFQNHFQIFNFQKRGEEPGKSWSLIFYCLQFMTCI